MDKAVAISIIAATLMVLTVGGFWLEKNTDLFNPTHGITILTH